MAFAGFVHRPDLAKVLFLVTIFVVVPGWLTLAAVRQTRLDDALIAAIKAGKDEDALNALKAGAHPDSRDTAGQSPPSLRETFLEEIKRLLGGKRKPHPMGPTALMLAVEGNRTDEVLRALRGDPAVGALHTTNGRWDIVAELRADSLVAFDRVLGRIRQIDGISSTETSLLLSTHKL